MKKFLFFVLFFSFFAATAQRPLAPGINNSYVDVVKGGGVFNEPAIIWLDSAYFMAANASRKYALIFQGHGTGEAGSDTVGLLRNGMMYNLNHGDRPWGLAANGIDTVRFIVVAPQRGSYGPDPAWYAGMFEDITKRFRVDSSRVYLSGMSAGGWMDFGVPINNTDTSYVAFISAIWVSSGAQQDVDTSRRHFLAERNIPLMMDVGDQTSDLNYANAAVALNNYLHTVGSYTLSDTIRQRGYGHDHFTNRVLVTTKYAKLGNKNIYQWFAQYTNYYHGVRPPNTCYSGPNKRVILNTTATNEIYHPNGSGDLALANPGDTLVIPALANTTSYVDIILQYFHGDACHPIYIINSGGQVIANYMRIKYADHFKLLGNGVGGTPRGFKLGVAGAGAALAIGISDHFEVAYTDVGNGADNGMLIKENPCTCDSLSMYPNYVMNNIYIHDNYGHDTQFETYYVGHTYPYADPYNSNLTPIRLDSVEIARDTSINAGWDGVQLSNALEGAKIHDNYVYNYGTKDAGSQRAGIILGANTHGDIYGNTVIKGTGNAIQVFGYDKVNVYSNSIDSGGRTQEHNGVGGTILGEQDIFSNDDSNRVEGVRPKLRLNIHDNTIHHQQVNKVLYTIVDQNQSDSLIWKNNTLCMTTDTTNWQTKYFNIGQPKKDITFSALLTNCGPITPPGGGPPPYVRQYIHFSIHRFRRK